MLIYKSKNTTIKGRQCFCDLTSNTQLADDTTYPKDKADLLLGGVFLTSDALWVYVSGDEHQNPDCCNLIEVQFYVLTPIHAQSNLVCVKQPGYGLSWWTGRLGTFEERTIRGSCQIDNSYIMATSMGAAIWLVFWSSMYVHRCVPGFNEHNLTTVTQLAFWVSVHKILRWWEYT